MGGRVLTDLGAKHDGNVAISGSWQGRQAAELCHRIVARAIAVMTVARIAVVAIALAACGSGDAPAPGAASGSSANRAPPPLDAGVAVDPPLVLQRGHDGPVVAIAWSPDSTLLLSAGLDGQLKLWDPATGAVRGALPGHADHLQAVAWSRDGSILATGGNGVIFLWDARTLAPIRTLTMAQPADLPALSPCRLSFSADGKTLAVASGDPPLAATCRTIQLVDVATSVSRPGPPIDYVWDVAWSPRAPILAVSSEKGVTLWNSATATTVATVTGSVLTWSADGTKLLTVGSDAHKPFKLWDGATGKELETLEVADTWSQLGWSTSQTRAAWSTDGTTIAVGAGHAIFDRRPDVAVLPDTENVRDLAFSPDGKWLAVAGDRLALFDGKTGARARMLSDNDGALAVAWSHDGALLAVSERDQIALWSFGASNTYAPPRRLPTATQSSAIAFGPDDTSLATGGAAFTTWDVASGRQRTTDATHPDVPCECWSHTTFLELSPDGRTVATGDSKGIQFRDAVRGTFRADARMSSNAGMCDVAIDQLAWSPDGRALGASVRCVQELWFTPDGGDARAPRGWVPPWRVQYENAYPEMATGPGRSASPDGHIVAYSDGHEWQLLDVPSGLWRERAVEGIDQMTWRPDGRFLALAGPGGVRIYRVADGASLWLRRVDAKDGPQHFVQRDDGAIDGDAAALATVRRRGGELRTGALVAVPARPTLIGGFFTEPVATVAPGRALLAAANALRARHQPREAVARANDVLLRDPDGSLAIDAVLARAFAQRDIGLEHRGNDLESAASSFGDVVRRIGDRDDPRSAIALLEKGRASEGVHLDAQAALSYDRLLARHDATPVAVASALVQRCALGQLGESRRCVELIRRFGATAAPDLRAVVDAARARLGAAVWQHYEELARAVDTAPTDPTSLRARCSELTDAGQHVAEVACRDDVRKRSHDADDEVAYADALARAGRADDARLAYVAIAKRCPGPRTEHGRTAAEACLGQARLLVDAGRPQDALPILDALLAANDVDGARVTLERSRAFVALKNDAKALAALDENNLFEVETLVAKLAILERESDLHDVEPVYAKLDSALGDAPYSQHATLARGLFEHADALGRHKDPIGERAGYRVLLDRFGDSTNPGVLQWVDKAAKRLAPP